MTEASELTARRAARVLPLDASGRVLLLRGCDATRPDRRSRFAVGGAPEPGGSPVEGACREVA